MENIENKVVLKLEDYLELRDNKITQNKIIEEIINLIYNAIELKSDKTELKLDSYYLKGSKILYLIKELDTERYNNHLKMLQNEYEEEEND